MRAPQIAFAVLCLMALPGCLFTAIGIEHEDLRREIDFGAPESVQLCVYLDTGITESRARELLSSWETEGPKYGLAVRPVSFKRLARSGFFHTSIIGQIESQTLAPNCDRKLYFVNRNVEDFLWGDLAATALPLPEILGEVDDATLTSGFVVATRISLNQVFFSPYAVTRHELYHLLGCKQHFDMPACYREIAALKRRERQLRISGFFKRIGERPFYPTWNELTGEMFVSRAEIDQTANLDREETPGEETALGPSAVTNP
jgi:hypothetical protein